MNDIQDKLKIIKVSPNKDGTTTLEFEIDSEFEEWFKKETRTDEFSHEEFRRFVTDLISNKEKNVIQK